MFLLSSQFSTACGKSCSTLVFRSLRQTHRSVAHRIHAGQLIHSPPYRSYMYVDGTTFCLHSAANMLPMSDDMFIAPTTPPERRAKRQRNIAKIQIIRETPQIGLCRSSAGLFLFLCPAHGRALNEKGQSLRPAPLNQNDNQLIRCSAQPAHWCPRPQPHGARPLALHPLRAGGSTCRHKRRPVPAIPGDVRVPQSHPCRAR